MQVYILCGGAGTRLGSVLQGGQKALVDIHGKPFLALVLTQLGMAGITRAILCAHYRADQIEEALPHLEAESGVALSMVTEPTPMGTGGAVLHALTAEPAQGRYLVLNADTFLSAHAYRMMLESDRDTLLAVETPDSARYGALSLGAEGRILALNEKSSAGAGLVNAGVYGFSPDTLSGFAVAPCSMEREILPALIERQQLYSVAYDGLFVDIGIPQALSSFRDMVQAGELI
ncbi:sugar phosphate nucleotidyltransferase [Corticimicrobacter populi]|uniref:HAD family hydrolase n=1 Tax=Corticimicrobacter populi TaxID=2175229 RepID=A0A2V1JTL5_9BURK|nr:sugar phosphate nucleotidyltransferase [Corticimicrobacter populi]PWF21224.1 HAD family hydrolase [Corticimicrobacter populi]